MSDLILGTQLVINGLSTGSLYALLAIGFTLIWKSVAVANFAQGDFALIGMFAALTFSNVLGWSILASLAVAIAVAFILGTVMERMAIRPIRRADAMTKILVTLGVSIIISNSLRLIFGPMPRSFPPFIGLDAFKVGGITLVPQYIGTLAIVMALILILQVLFYRTMTGKALRAVAENRDVASLMGINQDRMVALSFALSSALGATAGVLLAPFIFVTTDITFSLLIKALLAAVIGGFGSYPGALLGGLLIGVLDNLGAFYISTYYRDVISFSILIVVLLIKPAGLLNKPVRDI